MIDDSVKYGPMTSKFDVVMPHKLYHIRSFVAYFNVNAFVDIVK